MRSTNPIFTKSEGFNGQPAGQAAAGAGQSSQGYGQSTRAPQNPYQQTPGSYQGYGDPSTWDTGAPPLDMRRGPRMTIDSVVQSTGISLGVVILGAIATWLLTGDPVASESAASTLYVVMMVGALGAFGLSLVNSFKRVVSPGLVIAFAALEGVALGAISKVYQTAFGEGVVTGAVIGTIAAFAGTLAAYKILDIRVTNRFRKIVVAAMFGFVGLALLDFMLSFFGASFGFSGFGPLGVVTSVVGLLLGVFMLILDFDFVERGIEAGLEERESWRAAFGMTVSLVWIYTNLLRLLAIFSQD